MIRIIRIFAASILFCAVLSAQNQQDIPEDPSRQLMRFSGNIHQFNNLFPQEKVYLEFDNTAYFQGEIIWFKAFVNNAVGCRNRPGP